MKLEPGSKAKVIQEHKHHPYKIGDEVIIYRKAIDGYKVISTDEDIDNVVRWDYLEEGDLEEIV